MPACLRPGLLFVSIALLAAAATPPPPNVLVILTDDHGIGDVAVYRPDGDVTTPALDRLAAEGLRFTAMRANATVCSPTRAALLTGRFPDRSGVPGVIRSNPADSWGHLAPGIPTLADLLGPAGYHRAIIGKWHLGLDAPNQPNDRGFDLFHGFLGDMMDDYMTHLRQGRNLMRHNRETITPTGHATELFTSWTIDYLKERASDRRPFFLYLAYNAPHFPIQPPPEALARVRARDPGMEEKRALNVALVEHLDGQIGRVLDTLRSTGLERSTLVLFTSDNGGSLPHAQHNGPWRGGKQSHYDGGLRVPFLARWPGVIAPGSRSDYPGLVFDIFPTALEAAGLPVPVGTDAVSLLPLLRGGPAPAGERDLYFVRREGNPMYGGLAYHALIRGEWKLVQNSPYAPLELYNLRLDPRETTDVIATNREVARRLQLAMGRHIQRGGAFPWQPPE
jgi:arylsulfatase A-like enzyme